MKELAANIAVMIYTHGETKTAYLSNYKKDEIISLYNYEFSFIITDINKDYIIISLVDDDKKYKIIDNKILLKEEVKIIDTSDASTSINIRLDSITD